MDATVDMFTQVSEGLEDVVKKYDAVTTLDLSPEAVMVIYDHWADQYDKDTNFMAGTEEKLYESFKEIVVEVCLPQRNVKILDIGVGTGKLGIKLKEAGFSDIDGIDCSAKMLDVCRELGIYRNLYTSILGNNPVPIESEHYDLLVSFGSFLSNHITEACFEELIRITKPGGKLVIAMHYGVGDPDYVTRFLAKVDRLECEDCWKVRDRKEFDEEVSGSKSYYFVIEKY